MYVYEENGCLDGTELDAAEGGNAAGFSQTVAPPPTTNGLGVSMMETTATMEAELHQQLAFDMGQQCFGSNDPVLSYEIDQEMGFNHHHQHQEDPMRAELMQNASHQNFMANSYPPVPPDLLNLFHLPTCAPPSPSLLPNSSFSFTNPASSATAASAILYDPLFPLNLPPHPPVFRELFQTLPHGYNLPASRVGSSFGSEVDDGEGIGGGDDHRQKFDNGVLNFTRGGMGCIGKGRGGKGAKPFATEKQRREHLNDKYHALKSLVPNPTKV